MQELGQVIPELVDLFPRIASGELPAYAALAMLLVRLFRLPGLQAVLPSWLRWPTHSLLGFGLVVVVTFVVCLVGGVVTGLGWSGAALAALPLALGAKLMHQGTQALGQGQAPYEPSISRPMSIVFPPPTPQEIVDRRAFDKNPYI